MKCSICRRDLINFEPGDDEYKCECPQCGNYLLSGTAIAHLTSGSHPVQIDAFRRFILSKNGELITAREIEMLSDNGFQSL